MPVVGGANDPVEAVLGAPAGASAAASINWTEPAAFLHVSHDERGVDHRLGDAEF